MLLAVFGSVSEYLTGGGRKSEARGRSSDEKSMSTCTVHTPRWQLRRESHIREQSSTLQSEVRGGCEDATRSPRQKKGRCVGFGYTHICCYEYTHTACC